MRVSTDKHNKRMRIRDLELGTVFTRKHHWPVYLRINKGVLAMECQPGSKASEIPNYLWTAENPDMSEEVEEIIGKLRVFDD